MPVTPPPSPRSRKSDSSKPMGATSATAKPPRKARAGATPSNGMPMIDPDQRRALIAQAAYFRAERRGFAPGHEAEDWLAAEIEVDTALTGGPPDPAMQ